MYFFAYSALFNAAISGLLGAVVILKNRKELINKLFFLLSVSVVFWSAGYWRWQIAGNSTEALFWVRILSIGSLFIPVFYFHWIVTFLGINNVKRKIIRFSYVVAFIFLFFSFSKFFIKNIEQKFIFSFWPNPGILYNIYLVFIYIGLTIFSLILLIKYYRKSDVQKKSSIFYIFIGSIIGFGGGATNFFLWYNVPILPYGNILVSLYPIALAVAIFKYQLFNMKVIATEVIVFAIWILSILRFVISQTLQDRIINGVSAGFLFVFGFLLIISVLKEVKHAEELEQLTKKLEGLSNYKSELISIVAHQLKNPLAVVKGYSSLVGDGTIKDPAKIQEVYQKIKLSTNKLIDLLNNLLDLGHIEDGKMHYEMDDTNLNNMFAEIVNDFQFAAEQKNLSLSLEPCDCDPVIKADQYKLSQVFRNLIDNAIKYTDIGWVKVRISLKSEADERKYILVEISDSGRGISAELLPKLFQRFQRGVEEKQILGSGLGLYISKEIVESHSGKIWVESEGEGKGSSFCVKLPLSVTPANS